MKRVIFALLVTMALTACASPGRPAVPADAGESTPSLTMLDDGVWPVNAYTDGLPVPAGTVRWAALDTERGNCGISLADISETDYEEYMETLRQEGFSVVENVSEEIEGQGYTSVCTLLSNGEKGLSISHVPDSVVIYVSFVE